MVMKFKVGDIVTNVDSSPAYKNYKGLKYKIVNIERENTGDMVYRLVNITANKHYKIGRSNPTWYGRRLRLVHKETRAPSWL